MPAVLRDDNWDRDRLERIFIDHPGHESDAFAVAMAVVNRASTMVSALRCAERLRLYFCDLDRWGVDPFRATSWDVQRWLDERRGLSPHTQSAYLASVHRLYEEAVDRGLITMSPARRIRVGPYSVAEERALSLEQAQLLLESIRVEFSDPDRELSARRDYLIVTFGLALGPRSAELRRLVWADLDLASDPPTTFLFRKRRRRERQPLAPLIVDALRGFRAAFERHFGYALAPEDVVVPALSAGQLPLLSAGLLHPIPPMSSPGLSSIVRARLEAIGIADGRRGTHRLRKTAATLAWMSGADPTDVQTMLGHDRLATTLQHYVKPAQAMQHPAAMRIPLLPPADA